MCILKTIAAIILLIFGMGALPAVGTAADLPVAGSDRVIIPAMVTLFTGQTLWAQNDTGENEKSDGSKTDTETKKTDSTDAEKDKASKSKPLKPFIPSEKIPGEQAVDFPVDI